MKTQMIVSFILLFIAMIFILIGTILCADTIAFGKVAENVQAGSIAAVSEEAEYQAEINILHTGDAAGMDFEVIDYYPASYEIYAFTENGREFIEASLNENSIYYINDCSVIYYGGVGSYYGIKNGVWIVLMNGNILEERPTICMEFNFDDELDAPTTFAGSNTPLPYVTTTYKGFTCIRDYYYFSTLKYFPDHVLPGTCGVVAVSMLLGYYNSMVIPDNKIIPNKSFVSGNGTNDAFAKYLFDNWIWDGKSSVAEGTIMGFYALTGNAPGFPMAAVENKTLISKYAKSINFNRIKHICSGWYPKTNTKKYLNTGKPIIGATTKYSMTGGKAETSFHNVIIYGYQDEKYLCHMGHYPGTTKRSEIMLSNLSLHSYYGIDIE